MPYTFNNAGAPFWSILLLAFGISSTAFTRSESPFDPTRISIVFGLAQILLGVGAFMIFNHLEKSAASRRPALGMLFSGFMVAFGALALAGGVGDLASAEFADLTLFSSALMSPLILAILLAASLVPRTGR